jgi:hypothetical protein
MLEGKIPEPQNPKLLHFSVDIVRDGCMLVELCQVTQAIQGFKYPGVSLFLAYVTFFLA